MMTQREAIEILSAAAICCYPIMSCSECPRERDGGDCTAPKSGEVERAVRLLMGGAQ